MHASAPDGYRCADCAMSHEACPTCYRAWWAKRHPNFIGALGEEPVTRGSSGNAGVADSEVEGNARVIQFMRILHSQVPEEQQPKGRSDFSDGQWERACAAYAYAHGVEGLKR